MTEERVHCILYLVKCSNMVSSERREGILYSLSSKVLLYGLVREERAHYILYLVKCSNMVSLSVERAHCTFYLSKCSYIVSGEGREGPLYTLSS